MHMHDSQSTKNPCILQLTPPLPSSAKPSNFLSSLTTLLTSTLGITILLMPKLFHQGGILFCSIQIIIMGLAIYLSSSMLVSVASASKSHSYFETITNVAGPFKSIAYCFYLLLLTGNILVYHAFVLKNLIPMIGSLLDLELIQGSPPAIILGVLLTLTCHFLILPFLFSRKLRIVKKISFLCSIAVIFSVFIIISAFFRPDLFDLPDLPVNWKYINYYKFDGLFVCTGYYLLSFTFQQILIEVTSELTPSNPFNIDMLIFVNCVLSSFLYIVVSFAGYLSVYNEQKLDGMNNYLTYVIIELNNRNPWLYVTNILVLLNVTFANILNYIPAIKCLNSLLSFKPKKGRTSKLQFNSEKDFENHATGRIESGVEGHFESPVEACYNASPTKIILNYSSENIEACPGNIYEDNKNQNFETPPKNLLPFSQIFRDENQRKIKNRFVVWFLFSVVLFFSLVTIVLDVEMDTIFDLVSAVGAPIVLLVLPAIFYITLIRKKTIHSQGMADYFVGVVVLVLGVSIWMVSIYSLLRN